MSLIALPLVAVLMAEPAAAACSDPPDTGVDWSKCEKRRLILRDRDLSDGIFVRTDFSRTDLANVRLVGADLTEANFEHARLAGADMSGAVMVKTNGSRADLHDAVMKGADLTKAELQRGDLMGADLTDAIMQKAEIGRADLTGARLDNADLGRAEIARAIFAGASLVGTNFEGAYTYLTRFDGVDLSRARGLTQQQLDAACGNADTMLPPGLEAPASWPCDSDG